MLLLFSVTIILNLYAQQNRIDSLKQLISSARSDTARVSLLNELCFVTFDSNPEEAFILSRQAESLAKKIKFRRGEARALDLMGDALERLGNYPKSLEVQLESLKMNEELRDTGAIAGCMISLANLHRAQQQPRIALDYLFKAERMARSVNDQRRLLYSINNIGSSYSSLKLFDSALHYLQLAYSMEIQSNQPVVYTANSLSSIHYQLGNEDLGLSYLKMAERSAVLTENNPILASIYLKKASLFEKAGTIDSAVWYVKRSFDLSMAFKLTTLVAVSAGYLSKLYINNPEEALRYHKIGDSAYFATNNIEKTRLFQNLAFNETDRQLKMEREKEKSREERKHNLQYAAIALGLITFVIFFFILSHAVIANQKVISFLGILALLIVFEFLNLLLHPLLDRITNHQPVLMLGAMVCIAALLIPLHHKLEHWITHKMVEKNKKIRLAAAKKTIAKLEGEQAQTSTI